jgi:hypothetical protein
MIATSPFFMRALHFGQGRDLGHGVTFLPLHSGQHPTSGSSVFSGLPPKSFGPPIKTSTTVLQSLQTLVRKVTAMPESVPPQTSAL